MDTTTTATAQAGPRGAVLTVSAGVFMTNLDLFIVNLAVPAVSADLGGQSLARSSWVLTAYAVVFAGLLVPLGRWADRVGRRRGYLLGLGVFTAASVLAAAAPTLNVLIAARAVQAVGAALVVPTSLSLLLATVPAARRAGAIGSWAATAAIAAASGPVLGGLLVQLSWRWVFLVNLPVGLAAMYAAARLLPESRDSRTARRTDLLGAAGLIGGVALFALVLVQGSEWGWTSGWTLAAVGISGLLLTLVAYTARVHPSPVLEPALLRAGGFALANLASLLFYAAFAAMILILVLFLTGVWGYSALRAGAAIAPGPLTVPLIARWVTPRLIAARGPGLTTVLGAVIFAVGFAGWAALWGAAPAYATQVLPGLLLTGVGVGLVMPATTVAAAAALPPERFATGSAVLTMSRQIGAVAGVAGLVAVLGSVPQLDDFTRGLVAFTVVSVAVALPAARLTP